MSKQSPTTPTNYGRIIVHHDNLDGLKFWIRVFELENHLAFAQSRLREQTPMPAYAMTPIINQYDAGALRWIYVLVLEVDILGVCGGTGVIFYADKAHEEQARRHRDNFADMIMKTATQRCEAGSMTEVYMTEPGAQE